MSVVEAVIASTGEIVPVTSSLGLPGQVTSIGLNLPPGLSYERWVAIGETLCGIERGVMWWIGDWLLYGALNYPDKYEEGVRRTGFQYGTLRNALYVARKFSNSSRRRDELSWSHHYEVAKLAAEEQDEFLELAIEHGWSHKELRSEKSRRSHTAGAALNGCDVTDLLALAGSGQKFGCIYVDPPWPYDNQATRAHTSDVYKTKSMSIEELCDLPVSELAADDAHLHMWTTSGFRFEPERIIKAWGFEYRSEFIWVKTKIGIGNYWRLSHETLLTSIRGDSKRFNDKSLRSWFECDRGEHSVKPEQVRAMIERASPGPYLELFGRTPTSALHRPNLWTVWGDEIDRNLFSAAAQ